MIPYLMQQADSLYAINKSLMRFFNNTTHYQFTLGSDIFVAPVLSSSNSISISSFPGTGTSWVYLFDNTKVYQSGQSGSLSIPLDQYPVFIKSTSPLLAVLDSVAGVTPVGIETLTAQHVVSVYPNPAKDIVTVSGLDFNSSTKYVISLFDALGRKLLSSSLTSGAESISVAELEGGVYYYSITSTASRSANAVSGKVVIQK
jgi:hypothetical protein